MPNILSLRRCHLPFVFCCLILLAACQRTDNDWQEAIRSKIQQINTRSWDSFSARRLPKLLKTTTNPDAADAAWLQLAFVLRSHEAPELAGEIFAQLEKGRSAEDRNWPLYRYFVATNQAENGQLDTALETLNVSLPKLNDVDRIAFLLTGATWLMDAGQYEQATSWLQRAEKISPHYPELLYRQATLALQNGQCQRAIDKLRLMLEYKPGLAQLYGPLASAYRQCQQPEQAEAAEKKRGEGKLHFDNRFKRQAEQLGNPVKFLRGQIHQTSAAGQLKQALKLNTQLLRLMPEDPSNHLNQGSILYRLGRYDLAAKAYRKGLQVNSRHADLLTNLGNALWQLGQVSSARQQYQAALANDPRHLQASINLAGLLLQSGQFTKAEDRYRKALDTEPFNILAQTGWIQALLAQKKYQQAIQAIGDWLRQRPADPALQELALKTLLHPAVPPETGRQLQVQLATTPEMAAPLANARQLIDLSALWRFKSGQLNQPEQILDWWQQARKQIHAPADAAQRQRLDKNLQQLISQQLPEMAQWHESSR